MTTVTRSGCESAIACEPPSISLIVAPMRCAAASSESGLIARLSPATMNQLGARFHPGGHRERLSEADSGCGALAVGEHFGVLGGEVSGEHGWELGGVDVVLGAGLVPVGVAA
jgi:hypothetical protein